MLPVALLGLSTLVAVYVLWGNFDNGLWYDEVYSLRIADLTRSWADAYAAHAGHDASPFTYYALLRIWRGLIGEGIYEAQCFNIAAFFAAVVAAGWVWPKDRRNEYAVFLSVNISCYAVLYYLLEVRPYSFIMSISLFAAACLKALEETGGRDPMLLRGGIVLAALVMISLHGWGALLGAGLLLSLFAYDRSGNRAIAWRVWIVAGLAAAGVFLVSFTNLIVHFSDRTTAAGVDPGDFSVSSLIQIFYGSFRFLYVTERSTFLVALVVAASLLAGIGRSVAVRRSLVLYLLPIIFVYVAVIAGQIVTGRLVYKSYFNVILLPFLFLFVTNVAYASTYRSRRWALIGALLLANLGSIPLRDKFPSQPYGLEIVDGISTYPARSR